MKQRFINEFGDKKIDALHFGFGKTLHGSGGLSPDKTTWVVNEKKVKMEGKVLY